MTSITLSSLRKMKADKVKITCLTAYDASFARLISHAGVDMLMIGDSLGMVVQGHASTLPVSIEHVIYHSQNVRRGCGDSAFVIADLPFMTYANSDTALMHSARLLQEGKANMVKMEGGVKLCETFHVLSGQGIPVCAHLGLQPQSVNKIGGYRVQGREEQSAQLMLDDALALEQAGADLLVLECIPSVLAERITQKLSIPTIGIGAGAACDGQVLVSYDMLGLTGTQLPKFVKNFMHGRSSLDEAVKAYVHDVRQGLFPAEEHQYA